MGNLYIVATPIGNLQDITFRGVETLKKVDAIACEDTRKTSFLLRALGIQRDHKDLISYYEQNEATRIPQIITFLKNGGNVALVSDAGTPAISDPGFKLIRECIEEDIKVESIPGASSVISSLVVSGLPTDKFLFLGYPPRKPGHRIKFFENIKDSYKFIESTIIIFEAPHKLLNTLNEMKDIFGDINVVVERELTKIHEEVRREKISKSIEHFQKTAPKGEFVILFNLK
ncbi:MAG TPA: 16S rRNA (cytidine(1402)-2'-O)-methyltransferase [Patescibacteria group bacterium]|nr:16S rRNA (cytidine(1402)-2'-O)-methyltransferase [Patescibacteria group bacterium]